MGSGSHKGGEGTRCIDGKALFFEISINNVAFLVCISDKNTLLENGGNDGGDVFV